MILSNFCVYKASLSLIFSAAGSFIFSFTLFCFMLLKAYSKKFHEVFMVIRTEPDF
jgi:hypothetical protein